MINQSEKILVYVPIKDMYNKLVVEVSIMNEPIISNWFNSLKPKEQKQLCTLMLDDIRSGEVIITNGLIRIELSKLITFMKRKGLDYEYRHQFWWFMYDSLKDIGQMKIDYVISNADVAGVGVLLTMKPKTIIPNKVN
jgi:hypothetical protein